MRTQPAGAARLVLSASPCRYAPAPLDVISIQFLRRYLYDTYLLKVRKTANLSLRFSSCVAPLPTQRLPARHGARAFRAAAQTSRRSRGASLADAAGQHRHLTGFRRGGGRSECGWIGAHPECPPCRLRPALCRLLHPCNARSVLATPIGTGVCNGRPIVCVAYGLSSCRLHRAEHTRTTGHRRQVARN